MDAQQHREQASRGVRCPRRIGQGATWSSWPATRDWLLGGGVSELVTNIYHVMMAGHVFGLTLKPYQELDPDVDLECALQYVQAHGLTASWIKNCRNSLKQFRRYLRLQRGLGEESKITPFDVPVHTQGLPEWLVSELERYLRTLQRNWREARLDVNIRGFWTKHLRLWRFLCEQSSCATTFSPQAAIRAGFRGLASGRRPGGARRE